MDVGLMQQIVIVVLALLWSIAGHAESVDKPARIGLCAACHGEDGIGRGAGIPHLAAQDEQYLRSALNQYRAGERREAAMRASAGALSVADIAALARWYAAQPRSISGAAP